uniref:Uncharacterized protein n=1 Tax=Arundo donax TaxID=35708 RepID=A0A0A8Y135_ARUDO
MAIFLTTSFNLSGAASSRRVIEVVEASSSTGTKTLSNGLAAKLASPEWL